MEEKEFLNILNKYQEDGLLFSQTHNKLPLRIWNYTNKVQYDGLWDNITTMCRGLVTDELGNVIARPFKKFFNIEEKKHTPTDSFVIYEKLDGSLGILFYYNDDWHIATRGSFHSEQAVKAKEMFEKIKDGLILDKECTYMLEIIYPENRIVVDYGDAERLVYLATIDTRTGKERNHTPFIDCAERYLYSDYKSIKELNWENREGFVVLFSNGDRCKIKFDDYLRLHKIVTNTSSVHIWEMLKNGDDLSVILDNVPDEFHKWAVGVANELLMDFENTIISAKYHYEQIAFSNRKEFADVAKKAQHPSLMFLLYDGRDITESVWKLIKPIREKAFSI